MGKGTQIAAALLATSLLYASPVWAEGVKTAQAPPQQIEATALKLPPAPELSNDQQQVLDKICQLIPGLKELSVEAVHNGGEVWSVYLSDRREKGELGVYNCHANLSFDVKTGELIRFNLQNPQWASKEIPSEELTKTKAQAFLQQLLGDQMKNYQLGQGMGYGGGESSDGQGHTVAWASASTQFERLINGVPLLNDTLQVGVDSSGHIVELYRQDDQTLDLSKFPHPEQAISPEKAAKIMADNVDMKLAYRERQLVRGPQLGMVEEKPQPSLMYVPANLSTIDALTGKLRDEIRIPEPETLTLVGEGGKLTAKTEAEAAKLVQDVFGVNLKGLELAHFSDTLGPGNKGNKIIYSWHDQTGNNSIFMNLHTLVDTGEVEMFMFEDQTDRGPKASISPEQAKQTAIRFLQKILPAGKWQLQAQIFPDNRQLPDWVDLSKLDQHQLPRPDISISFQETFRGVPISDRSYVVTIDGIIGKVIGYTHQASGTPAKLPDNKNVVTPEAAKAELLKNMPLQLCYIWPEYYDQKAPAPELVYFPMFKPGWDYIDAFTGQTVWLEEK